MPGPSCNSFWDTHESDWFHKYVYLYYTLTKCQQYAFQKMTHKCEYHHKGMRVPLSPQVLYISIV